MSSQLHQIENRTSDEGLYLATTRNTINIRFIIHQTLLKERMKLKKTIIVAIKHPSKAVYGELMHRTSIKFIFII